RPRPAAAALAAAWVATGAVFFSLAAAKRSVYLLPLHPAVALLLGAGVAAPPANGRLERLARLGALLFEPAGLGLAALGGALVLGFEPVPLVQPWLRPDDSAGAATLAAAVRAAAPWLALLTGATAAASPLLLWEDGWQRLRDQSGPTLTVLAVSAARQARRGRLALVAAPVGPLVRAPDTAVPPPLAVRTGSRSRSRWRSPPSRGRCRRS